MLVRPYEERDSRFWEVRGITYNDGQPIPDQNRTFKVARGFVAEVDDRIQGIYSLLPMNATRGRALLSCGGIAGVAVDPTVRRRGVGAAMMTACVRQQRSDGFLLSSLYPFREPFYRKAGYQTCGMRYRISCPADRLAKVDADMPIERVTHEQFEDLAPVLQKFAHARSGLHIRNRLFWSQVLNERQAIYVAGDPVEAYAVVEHKTDFWVDQEIREFVWATERGYRAMLGLFAQVSINKTRVVWHEPSDSPYLAKYLDQGVSVESNRPIMYRVNDVPGALRALRPQSAGSFTIELIDDSVPENHGPWEVEFDPNGVEVRSAQYAGIRAPIQLFTCAFLGQPSWADLARNGLIEFGSDRDLDAAVRLMPANPVYNLDFF